MCETWGESEEDEQMALGMISRRSRGEEGTALVIALLLLTGVSLIGVYAVFTSTVATASRRSSR